MISYKHTRIVSIVHMPFDTLSSLPAGSNLQNLAAVREMIFASLELL